MTQGRLARTMGASEQTARHPSPTPSPNLAGAGSPASGLDQLLSYRLSVVSNLLSRSQALRVGSNGGLSQHEWRLLVLIDSYGPLPVKALSRHAGLDFGQASRIVSRICEAGLVDKRKTTDGRSVELALTASGAALHRKLWSLAMRCNEEFLSVLSQTQREVLMDALDLLAQAARTVVDSECGGNVRRA